MLIRLPSRVTFGSQANTLYRMVPSTRLAAPPAILSLPAPIWTSTLAGSFPVGAGSFTVNVLVSPVVTFGALTVNEHDRVTRRTAAIARVIIIFLIYTSISIIYQGDWFENFRYLFSGFSTGGLASAFFSGAGLGFGSGAAAAGAAGFLNDEGRGPKPLRATPPRPAQATRNPIIAPKQGMKLNRPTTIPSTRVPMPPATASAHSVLNSAAIRLPSS